MGPPFDLTFSSYLPKCPYLLLRIPVFMYLAASANGIFIEFLDR